MEFYSVVTGVLGVNTYFLTDEKTRKTIVIDGGEKYSQITEIAKQRNFIITDLLLTHAHFDHAGNAKRLSQDGVRIGCSKIDGEKLISGDTLSSDFNKDFDCVAPDFIFSDGEILNINGIKIEVLLTPGHTDGSACFIVDNMIFSGDTVFFESFGRTDFPTGDFNQMRQSFKRIFSLEGEFYIFPGHGEKTTLSHEKKYNPIVNYL